jgi:hypothetical protein
MEIKLEFCKKISGFFITKDCHFMNISNTILRRIRGKKRGWVFTAKDFIDIASRNNIDVTLHRLVAKGIIRKISIGIFDFPIIHPKLGEIAPNPDALAKVVAQKKGGTLHLSGASAANQLGVDTQVPAKPTYLTSGPSAKRKIGHYTIALKHSKFTSNEQLNDNVINVVNALLHLGKDNVTPAVTTQLQKILTKKDKLQLKRNLSKFPDWLAPIILKLQRK